MTAIQALIGFAAWTLALVVPIVLWRFIEVARGKRVNSWTRGKALATPDFITRMEHAHLNSLENLPIFAVIVLAAVALEQRALVDGLACWILYARLAQSVVHIAGGGSLFVLVRATFYFVQLGLFFYLLWNLAL